MGGFLFDYPPANLGITHAVEYFNGVAVTGMAYKFSPQAVVGLGKFHFKLFGFNWD